MELAVPILRFPVLQLCIRDWPDCAHQAQTRVRVHDKPPLWKAQLLRAPIGKNVPYSESEAQR